MTDNEVWFLVLMVFLLGFIIGASAFYFVYGENMTSLENGLIPYCQTYQIESQDCEMIYGNIQTGDYKIE